MKKFMFFAIALMMFVTVQVSAKGNVAPEAKPEVATAPQTTLKGLVCDKQTKELLAGATIMANGQKVYTDLDGNFMLSNLCNGKCQIKVSLISYKDQTIEVDPLATQNLQIKLEQR